jgi:hypothetical protein
VSLFFLPLFFLPLSVSLSTPVSHACADVWCVVEVDTQRSTAESRFYRIAFIYRPGVIQTGPYLPAEASFEKSDQLRKFLLTKRTLLL